MKPPRFSFWMAGCVGLLLTMFCAAASGEDEGILRKAGLSSDGPSLLAFFQARARMDVESEHLRQLVSHLAADSETQRAEARAQLLGLGPLALPALRQAANNLDCPQAAARAASCLPWLEGPSSDKLLTAAAHLLARHKPEGAAAALLAYLPCAENPEVISAVNAALAAVAAPEGKPDPALLRGLNDLQGTRRAAAVVALCHALPPQQAPEVRKLLNDPAPIVRLRAAKALAEAKDADAIPVLIELLAELPAHERQSVEELLKQLAGEWAPILEFARDDDLSRGVRRDTWASWWRRSDGPMLLTVVAKHTLTPAKRRKLQDLLRQLGSDDFKTREDASEQLLAFGRLALPSLREAIKDRDPETARRAKMLIERLESRPEALLPIAAVRLLAVRKPAGAVEVLLAYLPFAEDMIREEEVRKSLIVLALRDGHLDPALLRGLKGAEAKVRAVAAEALIEGGGSEGRAAARKLLGEDVPSLRLRLALALARAGEREGVSVLIDLLPLLSAEECNQAEEALHQLAGDSAPEMPTPTKAEDAKKRRDAWAAWWKVNAGRIDPSRLAGNPSLGYTLICDNGTNRVFEIDRNGKQRWSIGGLQNPVDAVVLPGNRVLIAELGANRVTERDFKGKILWQVAINQPISVQRLPNGHTFIASMHGNILEADPAGKESFSLGNFAGNILAAYRWHQGNIVCKTADGKCRILDTTGKQLKDFPGGHTPNDPGGLDLGRNDHILITRNQSQGGGEVAEFNREGRLVLQLKAPDLVLASLLPNGHILVGCNGPHVYEMDRSGHIVWEYKGAGRLIRARRR